MDFSIVLACDNKNGIALEDNKKDLRSQSTLPWYIPEDLKYFKMITSDTNVNDNKKQNVQNVVIMGRKTADTLKKPLSNRINIVITSINNYRQSEGFESYTSFNKALDEIKKKNNINKVFMVGGAILADEAIKSPYCKTIYITHINHDYSCNVKLSDDFMSVFTESQDSEIKSGKYDLRGEDKQLRNCLNLNKVIEINFAIYDHI